MRPFNLLRYFMLASLGVVAALAIAVAGVFSFNLERNLTEEAGLYAADMTRALNRAIFFEFLLPRSRRGEGVDLEDPAQRAELDALVENLTRGLRILTVNLFDLQGTIIYSTNPDYLGYRSIDNAGIAAALAQNRTVSFLKRAELEAHPIRPTHDLLESYTPFYELDPASQRAGEVIGILELYQDARPITTKISEGRRQILGATTGLMTLLFVALFAIVRGGHLRIEQLTDALERSNRELEDRVRARTLDIETARARLRRLFDGIQDGISVIDQRYRVAEANSAIGRLFGAADRAPEGPCHVRYARRPEPCPGCPARAAWETGGSATQRYHWPLASGKLAEVEVTTFPFTTEVGRPAVIEVVRDVSERAELERQVVQSTSLANLGEMAAGIAHEIRNPIGMIQSAAQLLEQDAAAAQRDRPLLEVIRHEADRVNRSITEFVGFAAPPTPSRIATAPGELLERVRAMLRPEAERRKVGLEVTVQAPMPQIFVDPELAYRALTNVVLNAIQIQEDGGLVQLSAESAGHGQVVIRIVDRGPGIADEDLERIFQPFYSKRSGGTGLGLSIVQRLVAANGGRIAVSRRADGTEFALFFPEVEA
jgi:signal transduction histidine kinase